MISGLFSGGLYLLPIFTGAYADKIGFRKSMLAAFSLLTAGYFGLGVLPTLLESTGLVSYGANTHFSGLTDSVFRWLIVPVLFIIMIGGSFIKSVISASVAKETTEATRARGYSIFYMMVNIGAFTGKTVIDPLRNMIGDQAYIYINYFSGFMTLIDLLAVFFLYKSTHTVGEGKSMREIGQGFLRIVTNWRLLILILIITGFWMVQHQLYATMPKYVIRMAGETAKPGWIANVNPFVVVCCVSFVTRWMAKRSAITSMNIGMFLIPVSALLMACGNLLDNEVVSGMSFAITAFEVPHDGTDNVGYCINIDGKIFSFLTDLGHITPTAAEYICKANYLVLEANYDEEMLKMGPYPQYLKERIAGPNGHMSNRETADFLAENINESLKYIWLCHLSKDNNHPELAYKTVELSLRNKGIIVGKDVQVIALKRNTPSDIYEFE